VPLVQRLGVSGFDDAKTVLIEGIIRELCRQRSAVAKVKEVGRKLRKRIDVLKLARRGAGLAFTLATGLPSPMTRRQENVDKPVALASPVLGSSRARRDLPPASAIYG
jgi:molybdopterin-guanine dinucleotide biosynthesis protein